MRDMTTSNGMGHGKYIEVPVPQGDGILKVEEGQSARQVWIADGSRTLPTGIVVEANASANICILVLDNSCEINLTADLVGGNSSLTISGIYVIDGDGRVAIRTDVRHRVPGCVSSQLINGIAGGQSRFKFLGAITVAPDAQKTEAYQTNRNLLISKQAVIDTKPQLEIYADDVKCSHGATIGSLNEDEQFYMRSRGIPENEARVLQMISFVSPVLDNIQDPDTRAELAERVEKEIRKAATR